MTTIVAPRPQAQTRPESSGCVIQIIAVGMIVFGSLFIYNKGTELLHNWLYDPDIAIEATNKYLYQRMDCLPGEMLEITPLGDRGAKSVRCVPGNSMPRGEPRG
jgi:hypothetical protein